MYRKLQLQTLFTLLILCIFILVTPAQEEKQPPTPQDGHRLRLAVSSSNSPRFEPNPNTGDTHWQNPKLQTATQTIYIGPSQVEIIHEMEFPAHQVNLGDFQSPLVTYNGSIYLVWVDDRLRTRIAKKSPDGTITTHTLFEETDPDPYHNEPSIGIDRHGYIHVVGNMHNSPYGRPDNDNPYYQHAWQYKVSDQPEDISSFTFVGGDPARTIPGTWITYPYFAHDRQGVLYIAFRHRIKFDAGWSPGIMAGAVARYDAEDKTWHMLGGTDYEHGVKTLLWNPGGVSAYQGYKVRLFIDARNRMHVGWNVFTSKENMGGSGATHVLYACSDDGGNTFLKADGQPYSKLPITLSRGDVVFQSESESLYNLTHVGVLPGGQPVTSFMSDVAKWSRWLPGHGWSEADRFPASFPARFVTDSQGVITAVDRGKLHRSIDGGQTWKSYAVDTESTNACIFDALYLAQTNQIRFQTQSKGIVSVYTVKLSGSQSPEVSE